MGTRWQSSVSIETDLGIHARSANVALEAAADQIGLHAVARAFDVVNAMSLCASFGLTTDEAGREVRIVLSAIDRWKQHFRSCGLSSRDIESLAEQIDRPFLKAQRRER